MTTPTNTDITEKFTAEQIFEQEWDKVTSLPCSEDTKHHMKYVFIAMQRYADQENKENKYRIKILAESLERLIKSISEQLKPENRNKAIPEYRDAQIKARELLKLYNASLKQP